MQKENGFVRFTTRGLAVLLSIAMVLQSYAWGQTQDENIATGPNAHAHAEAFEGIMEAKIDFAGGMPRLLINREPVLPLIFFFNTAGGLHEGQGNLEPQVKLSAGAGVHIYSMPFVDWPWVGDGTDFSKSDQVLDRFIEVDPQAVFILRIWSEPPGNWSGWKNASHEKGGILHADGSRSAISAASDFFWEKFKESLVRLIHRYEASPYGKRILGYHIGGQNTTEWFHQSYREKGPDYSEVNQRRFRSWLTAKYKTDEVLAAAWGDGKTTLETARIPLWSSGRFPIRSVSVSKGRKLEAFYQLPAERDWVDFSSYATDIIAERIIDVSKLIKKETQGRKLTSFFYGYTFDLCASMSGHNAMHRILKCPAIDLLCSPISYIPMEERVAGGLAGYMTAVDSVGAHGKIWINEDDLPTYLVDPKKRPSWLPEEMLKHRTKGLEDTLGVLGRNLSTVFVHRAGTWWMDLIAAGAFNDAQLWQMHKDRSLLYRQIYEHPTPYRPDVALIVDERSVFYVKSDWDVSCNSLPLLRNACGKSGVSVGYYYLDDFIEGVVPPCKAYVFANTFYLDDTQIEAIHSRLDREGATAIWQYAPGYMGPSGADVNRCSEVTGIRLAVQDGRLGSRGVADFDGLDWGWAAENMVSPRLIVEDRKARPLGRYVHGGKISAATAQVGKHTSVFFGDFNLNPKLLARLFEKAGAHIWTRNSEVIHTDGNILAVHFKEPGVWPIYLPTTARSIEHLAPEEHIVSNDNKVLVRCTSSGETHWFRILTAQPTQTAGAESISSRHGDGRMSYLDNGVIRIGIDLAQGGAITYLADSRERVNVVNDFDRGRQIQMSLFMGPVPYLPESEKAHEVWHVLGYNPVQVGDAFGNCSSVANYRNDGKSLYVKCIPLLFPLDNVAAECVFESWIRLEGRTVHVRNRLTNHRSDTTQYPPRFQELPALYTTPPLYRLVSYTGDKPYTSDVLTRFTKVWDGVLTEGTSPWNTFESTENWAALLRDDDWGLGVWNPGVTHFLGGFFNAGNGKHIPEDNSAGYIAPGRVETLDHNIQYEYNYVLILGTLKEIRSYVYEHANKSRSTLPDHGFEHDREHWHYENARDGGWPIHGELHVFLEQMDPQIIGPSGFWRAEDAPRLFVRAACKTSDTRAQVYWKCVGDTSFSEEKSLMFQIDPDGEYHTYELDLSASPHYRGAIAGLRFDPVREGTPGDFIKVSHISFRDQEK